MSIDGVPAYRQHSQTSNVHPIFGAAQTVWLYDALALKRVR